MVRRWGADRSRSPKNGARARGGLGDACRHAAGQLHEDSGSGLPPEPGDLAGGRSPAAPAAPTAPTALIKLIGAILLAGGGGVAGQAAAPILSPSEGDRVQRLEVQIDRIADRVQTLERRDEQRGKVWSERIQAWEHQVEADAFVRQAWAESECQSCRSDPDKNGTSSCEILCAASRP